MADAERYAWDRRAGESSKAYDAFREYRDLGPRRGYRSVMEHRGSMVPRWSRTWDWVARATAWDDEQARIEDSERMEALRAMHSNHARAARALQQYALAALSRLDVESASPADVARLLELGAKLERITLTQSVEELQGKPTHFDADDPWGRITRELADAAGA